MQAYYAGVNLPDWDGGYDVDAYPSYGSHWMGSGRPWIDRLGQLGAYGASAAEEAFARSRRVFWTTWPGRSGPELVPLYGLAPGVEFLILTRNGSRHT